jgi:hypothetical protein
MIQSREKIKNYDLVRKHKTRSPPPFHMKCLTVLKSIVRSKTFKQKKFHDQKIDKII